MSIDALPKALRPASLALAAASCLVLAACGGGGPDDEPTEQAQGVARTGATTKSTLATRRGVDIAPAASANTLQVGVTIPGFPHKLTVYRPAGATKAIVFLHGLGGTTGQFAYDLGFNRIRAQQTAKNVNWDWLARNGIIAVFAQGQVPPGGTLPAWSNYVTDSGQDDVAFLKALSGYVKTKYGASEVSLSGHSAGGAMTARMWCEASTAYKAFVSLAGPMPSTTYPQPSPTCVPSQPAPYFIIVGGKDSKLPAFASGRTTPTPEQIAAGLTDTILTSEWGRHQDRSGAVCGEAPALADQSVDATGPTWNNCNGRVRYSIVTNADHPVASLEQNAHVRMVDLIAGFVAKQ